MPLAGHWTKLQAVNEILDSIGEDPVNSLASGLPDAEKAEKFIDDTSRRIQLKGWHCNTRRGITLTKDVNDVFGVPDNTLKVDTVGGAAARKLSTPRPSSHIDVSMRRDAADTQWLLYDIDNDSETWTNTNETELTVDIVQLFEFANLTPALQMYVFTSAAHRFQKATMGSAALFEFTREDVDLARDDAVNEDFENEDNNLLRDNAHVRSIVWRNNPGFSI